MSDSAASTELLAAAKDLAARNIDCYALLGLPTPDAAGDAAEAPLPSLTRDAVQRAWRKRAPMYHPDQAGAAFDQAKWEEFGLARDVLASEEARAAYDGARAAAGRKRRERDLMSSRQRQFAEELERAESGGTARGRQQQQEEAAARAREEDEDRARQAARGRAVVEERRRKVEEAEARERERERREDEQRDDKIRRLEEKIAEKARRRAEKKAKREGRRGVAANADADEDVEMLSPHPAVPAPAEPKPFAQQPKTTAPVPAAVDVQMSDDPVQFWETQWPKTKARLLAAQATKERRVKEAQAAA